MLAETDLVRADPETPPVGECATTPAGVEECEMRLVKIDVLVPDDPGAPMGLTTLVDPSFRDYVSPPLSWGIVAPEDDPEAEVEIVLRGFYGSAEAEEPYLVDKHAVVRFVPDEVRLLCLNLEASCVDVNCPDEQTCHEGTCRDAAINSATLPIVADADSIPACPDWP